MMGSKKLLNTSSSPPIAYKLQSNMCEEEKPLRQQISNQQHTETNTINTTCQLQKQNTNKLFTKIRNYLRQFRAASTSALSATQKHCTQQQRKRHHHQHYRHQKLTECNSIPIVQSTSSMLSVISIAVALVFLASINGVAASPVFVDNPSLAQFQSGRNIRHLPCIVRKSGRSGVCMFAIDCIKQNGTHLGTCIDRFYFGSCCDIKEEELTEIADNSIDQNTISHHFTSESSTLPTSALFKLTTSSPLQQHENTSTLAPSTSSSSSSDLPVQPDVTQILNSVTQSLVVNSLNDTQRPTSSSTAPSLISSTSTTKPSQQTTHKQSHFVIRTTTKPTKYASGAKPSHNTTIKRKTTPSTTTTKATTTSTTSTTTTKQPVLTTSDATPEKENPPFETTTLPTKLFTYQIVETTAYTPTEEATNIFDFVTTERTTIAKATKLPQATTTTSPPKATTTKQNETAASSTEAVTTPKITTIKTKPQTTRKPTTTKKPTSIKRTTRRPITTTTTISPTDAKLSSNPNTEMKNFTISTTGPASTTFASNRTTLAPRPRPKPTATIVKVPKPTATTTSTSTTTTALPTSTAASEMEKLVTTTSYTTKNPTTSTTPSTTTTAAATTTTAAKTTTTTTPRTTATTTHRSTHKPSISSTTHKPGLVTWTNIDGKPIDPSNPSVSDWVPVTSQTPINIHNKIEDLPSGNVTYEEMDVSVSSSVSAMMNNTTVIISAPHKPIHISKPTTSTTTTSSTTPTATTDSSFSTTRPNASSTTSANEQQETNSTDEPSPVQFTTEGISSSTTTLPSSAVSTAETTTENSNLNSTTTSPYAGLEGVDYRQVCGRRMFPEPRIVGGSNAAFGRWPWQISLRQWRTSTYLHKCGAALLNENWAITAAHCVDNVPPSDLLLRLGEYDLAEEEEPYGYQERRVQIVASHPQFDPRTFEYDLALLRFYEPVVFQPNIIPVCVPENDEDFIGQTAFVTGWGRLYEDGPLPSVLQEVAVPVINNTICESMYRAAGYIEHIPHIFICAGWKKGGYDSCEGDSGGPMVLQRESDKRFQLGGVISWGIGCAEANQPGVYTRISEFRDWINQILQF